MKKTKRIDIRVTPDMNKLVETKAGALNKNKSEYICSLIEHDLKSVSHEQLIQNSLCENEFINSLLTNTELPDKSKRVIGKEMRKYV